MYSIRTIFTKLLVITSLVIGITTPIFSQPPCSGKYVITNYCGDFLARSGDDTRHGKAVIWAEDYYYKHIKTDDKYFNVERLENGKYFITSENGDFLTCSEAKKEGFGAQLCLAKHLDEFKKNGWDKIIYFTMDSVGPHQYSITNGDGALLARPEKRSKNDIAIWLSKKGKESLLKKVQGESATKEEFYENLQQRSQEIASNEFCKVSDIEKSLLSNIDYLQAELSTLNSSNEQLHSSNENLQSNLRLKRSVAALAGGYLVAGGAYLAVNCGDSIYKACHKTLSKLDSPSPIVTVAAILAAAGTVCCYKGCNTFQNVAFRAFDSVDYAVSHASYTLNQAINVADARLTQGLNLIDSRTGQALEIFDVRSGQALEIIHDDSKKIIRVIDKATKELANTTNVGIREAGSTARSLARNLTAITVAAGSFLFLGNPIPAATLIAGGGVLYATQSKIKKD